MEVQFQGVSCNHIDPLQLQFSNDLDASYFSVQVLNSNYPVFNMSVRATGQEEWQELIPRYWNFFERPENEEVGSNVDLKVDCSFTGGGVVEVDNIQVQPGLRIYASQNC